MGHLPSFLIRENKWRAARYGIDGKLIINKLGDTVPIKQAVQRLLAELGPTGKELKSESDLSKINKIVYPVGRKTPQGVVQLLGTCTLLNKPGCFATASHVTNNDEGNLVVVIPQTANITDYQDTTNKIQSH